MSTQHTHIPVLTKEVTSILDPRENGIYVDATFGTGGHSKFLLQSTKCKIYGIDRDPSAEKYFQEMRNEFGERVNFLQGNFSMMDSLLSEIGINAVDGIIMDLGVSSIQLDNAERGFSFMREAKLDMRMSQEGMDAEKFINRVNEMQLRDIIYQYGDETRSRQIARAIIQARGKKRIESTTELAEIIRNAIPGKRGKIDQATKTFQAIRIWINNEMEELKLGLNCATNLLAPQGKLVVIGFHSLEDKITKDFFRSLCADLVSQFKILTKKVIKPSIEEVRINPRSRSARMRAIERLDM